MGVCITSHVKLITNAHRPVSVNRDYVYSCLSHFLVGGFCHVSEEEKCIHFFVEFFVLPPPPPCPPPIFPPQLSPIPSHSVLKCLRSVAQNSPSVPPPPMPSPKTKKPAPSARDDTSDRASFRALRLPAARRSSGDCETAAGNLASAWEVERRSGTGRTSVGCVASRSGGCGWWV